MTSDEGTYDPKTVYMELCQVRQYLEESQIEVSTLKAEVQECKRVRELYRVELGENKEMVKSLRAEVKRLTFLHDLDHKLADQRSRELAEAYEAIADSWNAGEQTCLFCYAEVDDKGVVTHRPDCIVLKAKGEVK